jgi:hypothetical protein
MENQHWSKDEFLAALYGAGPLDNHPDTCAECGRRWDQLLKRREVLRRVRPEVSQDFLAAQRRSILARLEPSSRVLRIRLAPLLAAALLLCVILTVIRKAPGPEMAPDIVMDNQIFEEVYSLASSSEPQAVQPLRSLFEESQ